MDRGVLHEEVSVPVAVDAEREIDDVRMVRATYFVVRTNAPREFWEIELPPLTRLHGVAAIGIAGVVYGAIRQSPNAEVSRFSSWEDIDAIFALEAEGLPVSVDLEDVWIPKSWIVAGRAGHHPVDGDEELARGEVFRVALSVFQQVYRYTSGDLDLVELVATDSTGRIQSSPEETGALYAWSARQIEITRQAFQSKSVKLRYRESASA